jgi:signal transduction histidine kinase
MVFVLIPSLFISVLTFTAYKQSLETIRLAELQDIAALKAERMEAHFAALKANMEVAQGYYNIKKNLPILTRLADAPNNPKFLAAKKMLDKQLQRMQSVLGLSDIMLVNPIGKVVYFSNPKHMPKEFLNPLPEPQQKAVAEGENRVYFSDIFLNKAQGNRPTMLIAAPAFDFDGAFIGVIAFEIDMASIYRLIKDITGLGATGEVLVGKKIGNKVIFLNPVRHDPETALNKSIGIGGALGGPIQEAVQGKKGAGRSIDYRGEEVIAAWRYIPSLDWGMVAKIDTREAFADVTNLRYVVIIILFIVFILCSVIAFSMARSISAPIKTLSNGAKIIGSGNLDYKIESERKDEIGQLSRTFDKMTQDLKKITASRDELNREITERKRAESVMQAQLRILAASNARTLSTDEVLRLVLDEIEGQTNSKIGFYHFVEADNETISLQNWSTNTLRNMCTAEGKGSHYPISKAGVWTDCVREQRPVIHNAYASLPHRKGLPAGHAPVIREMVVPILRDGRIVAIIGVGNKPSGYDETDIAIASLLGDISWEIVERKQAEKHSHALMGELKRSNADLEQFAYVASHDLQEPLRVVAGFVGLLDKRYREKLDDNAREFIEYAVDGVKRMQILIKDLLAYSQVGTKGKTFEPTNCSVALEQAIYNLHKAIEESGAELTYDLLPTVSGDSSQLTRLFQNLIGNAIKYRGKDKPEIHISAQKKGDEWVVSVRDNGIGIGSQYFEKIFDVFRRLHTKKEYDGTGIGLAVCKKIVERHGGKIWVESAPGKGSTFYFTVPAGN